MKRRGNSITSQPSFSNELTYPLPTSPFAGKGADRGSYYQRGTVPSPAKGRVRVGLGLNRLKGYSLCTARRSHTAYVVRFAADE